MLPTDRPGKVTNSPFAGFSSGFAAMKGRVMSPFGAVVELAVKLAGLEGRKKQNENG